MFALFRRLGRFTAGSATQRSWEIIISFAEVNRSPTWSQIDHRRPGVCRGGNPMVSLVGDVHEPKHASTIGFSKAWQGKKNEWEERGRKRGPKRRPRPLRVHSPALGWLSLVGLRPHRAQLCFTRQMPLYSESVACDVGPPKPDKRAHRVLLLSGPRLPGTWPQNRCPEPPLPPTKPRRDVQPHRPLATDRH